MNKAVFLDRDHTIIEDPGYLSEPGAVKLLPGVEGAIRSLGRAGYKVVVVTNQSGVARGLLSEDTLGEIHAQVRRLLAERGAHVDAIYYCPYHSEGTVEQYAIDSELRKPRPGMLLKAAKELDIDLTASWMIGDSPRDVEAGQRAGCRTIRLRTPTEYPSRDAADEDCQGDFTVRNLPEAARVILRSGRSVPAETAPEAPLPQAAPSADATGDARGAGDEQAVREILRYVRQLARADQEDRFSFLAVIAGAVQALAVLTLAAAIVAVLGERPTAEAQVWALVAVALQVMALTFFTLHKLR